MQAAALACLWAFATALNLGKAFHIDDTAYLEIARWIAAHPLHPMQGEVFWGATPERIGAINQPHLYLYVMALWGSVFGWSEVAIHSLLAVFSLAATWLMFRLAQVFTPRWALVATALVIGSPAFVVGQNTMLDVPLLALWLGFFVLLARPGAGTARALALGGICAAAILVKYTSLVLLPILVVDAALAKDRARWYAVGIVLLAIGAWSAFNVWDYGAVHLWQRRAYATPEILDPGKWLLALGATMPCAAALAYLRLQSSRSQWTRYAKWAMPALGAAILVLIVAVASRAWQPEDRHVDLVLVAWFVASGVVVVLAALATPWQRRAGVDAPTAWLWMLVAWVAGVFAFTILLAPFVATRHVLLALPPLVLLALRAIPADASRIWIAVAVASNVLLAGVVARADAWYAGIYRDEARQLRAALPPEAKVWTVGHWGWQWYSRLNGMTPLGPGAHPAVGDYVVYPEAVDRQPLPEGLVISTLRVETIEPKRWIEAFAARNAGFYATSAYSQIPWSIRHSPIERFVIGQVTAVER